MLSNCSLLLAKAIINRDITALHISRISGIGSSYSFANGADIVAPLETRYITFTAEAFAENGNIRSSE